MLSHHPRANFEQQVRNSRDQHGGRRVLLEVVEHERRVRGRVVTPRLGYVASVEGWKDGDGEQIWVKPSTLDPGLTYGGIGRTLEPRSGLARADPRDRLEGPQSREAGRVERVLAPAERQQQMAVRAVNTGERLEGIADNVASARESGSLGGRTPPAERQAERHDRAEARADRNDAPESDTPREVIQGVREHVADVIRGDSDLGPRAKIAGRVDGTHEPRSEPVRESRDLERDDKDRGRER